jgi:hypothetical protein
VNQLILAVQKVELLGGEGWLEHNSVALAAIGAASLAALVSIFNRRAELRHDREMRNRNHLRETLDLSFDEVRQAIQVVSHMMGLVHGIEEWRSQAVPDSEEQTPLIEKLNHELEAARETTKAAILDLFTTTARLQMRFGSSHPITAQHEKFRLVIDALSERAPFSLDENRAQEERDTDIKLREESGAAYAEFREACFDWLNK